MTVLADKLRQISFFDHGVLKSGRTIRSLSFFVAGEWHNWFAAGGELHKLTAWPAEAGYFGDAPQRATDQYFPILDLIAQRLLDGKMHRPFSGLEDDFQNIAASLAKLRLFFELGRKGREVRRFALTEIEYLVTVARSIFDLLQEIVAAIWKRIALHGKPKNRELPSSFADVAIYAQRPRTAVEISQKYRLPPQFADWYVAHAGFLSMLRELRTQILHGGTNPVEALFCTERGFAIQRWRTMFGTLYNWPTVCELPNQLVPLRPALCSIVRRVFDACDSFAAILLSGIIALPKELAPGLRYYYRGLHDCELDHVQPTLDGALWCDSGPAPTSLRTPPQGASSPS